jgi:DHA1 family bicyclomycin/chloramphenicol resistance-like MFS transporter
LRVLDLFPARRGLVSSCQSATQSGMNAITASMLAPLVWGSTLSLALAMAGFLLLGMVAFAFRTVRWPISGSADKR